MALLGLTMGPACSDGDGPPMDNDMPSPEITLTEEGWTLFESGSNRQALDKFRDAIAIDDGYSDAHHGSAWALAFLDSLGPAFTAFTNAIDRAHPGAEAYAGRAFVRVEPPLSDLQGGVDDAGAALEREAAFSFEHDPTIDWRDLRLLRAQAFLVLGRTTSAAQEVLSLGGMLPSPQTPAFTDSLLAEIERLGGDLTPPAL